MQDPFDAKEGRIDVARVMAGIRDGIRRRRDERSTSVEDAVTLRLRDLADESGIHPELLAHLLAADGRWNLTPDYRIQTHRKGLEGRLVVFLKSLVRPVVRLYTDPIVERQAQVNLYLLHLARTLLAEVTRLEREMADLGARRDRPGTPRDPDEPA